MQAVKCLLGLAESPKRDLPVLHGVSGRLRPGTLTLLLGPPGCGKTLLLKILAGRDIAPCKVSLKLDFKNPCCAEVEEGGQWDVDHMPYIAKG